MSVGEATVYRKHDSFAAIRHRVPLSDDVWVRIARVRDRLEVLEPDAGRRAVVQQACAELFDETPPPGGRPFTLPTYVVEEISRLPDQALPRYLWYRYRYEVYPSRKFLDAFPPCLQVEPASVFNYRCVFCYQTDASFTKRTNGHMGTMSLELFKRVVDEAEGRCEAVTLASRGEPLLCSSFREMLAYLAGKFLALKLNTNASLLDEAMCHAILQSDVNTVVFSIDAAAEPAYSRLRVGGALERVRRNVERFQAIRATQYPRSRTITRVSGVKVEGASTLDDMTAIWGDVVDQVAFVQYNPWENTYGRPVNNLTTPCSDLWRRMFIWWDGTVNPCDVDYKSTLAVGDANAASLSALWRSDRYQQLREHHAQQNRSRCSPCNRCTVV